MDYGPGGTFPNVDARIRVRWGNGFTTNLVRREGKKTEFRVLNTDDNVKGDWHYCAWLLPVKGYRTADDSGEAPESSYDGDPDNCPSGATVLVRDNDGGTDDDDGETTNLRVTSIERRFPSSSQKTDAPSKLTWRVTFSEGTRNLDATDFTLTTAGAHAPDITFGARATRRESDDTAPEHIVGLEAVVRW